MNVENKERLIRKVVEMGETIKGVQLYSEVDENGESIGKVVVADKEYSHIRGVLICKSEEAIYTVREVALTIRAVVNQMKLIKEVAEELTFNIGEIREERKEADIVLPFLKGVKYNGVEVFLDIPFPFTAENLKKANVEVFFHKTGNPDSIQRELERAKEIVKIMRRDR